MDIGRLTLNVRRTGAKIPNWINEPRIGGEGGKWVLTNTINNAIACATKDVRHSRAVADLSFVLYRDARVFPSA